DQSPINGFAICNLRLENKQLTNLEFNRKLQIANRKSTASLFAGEVNCKRRSLAQFGLHVDPTLVVFDDFFADGQAKAGSLLFAALDGGFGGEEGLEDFGDQACGNPWAGVDDLHADLVRLEVLGFDGDGPAAPQHGLAGV